MRPRSLIVEDDPGTQRILREIVEHEGMTVDLARDGDVAIEMLSRRAYTLIVLDIVLPTVSGTAVLEYLGGIDPESLAKVIVVTGVEVDEIRALYPGVRQAMGKPVLPSRFRAAVRGLFDMYEPMEQSRGDAS